MTTVLHVPAFSDNYIWLISGTVPGHVAIVDPGDAAPVLTRIEHDRLMPVAILCTHHHGDHVGGVMDLLRHFRVPVYGPAREHIEGVSHPLHGGEHVQLDAPGLDFDVLTVPGHTAGHIAYYGDGKLFCGDTLFSAGCGRLFEGTAEQMHESLSRLAALPDATEVYCAHEYTEANLRFALAVEPDNPDIRHYQQRARSLRAQNRPTLPSTIDLERRVNPFLRAAQPAVRRAAEAWCGSVIPRADVDVFTCLRRWKDGFKG
jgi:hydroxyacylglutathione hydrolase